MQEKKIIFSAASLNIASARSYLPSSNGSNYYCLPDNLACTQAHGGPVEGHWAVVASITTGTYGRLFLNAIRQ